ncbi:hypothetical protein Pcinc_038085 [Petrolisthes cinctipes]|uniref:Uncharacterized protein n=1 Tax=Petrolisthes cinctipes TaxID=88211 RepID=A0AAE1EKU2_PETCI|nr:hypothetical protein Pcinc_038085 [Petrolisthes cinctipes]
MQKSSCNQTTNLSFPIHILKYNTKNQPCFHRDGINSKGKKLLSDDDGSCQQDKHNKESVGRVSNKVHGGRWCSRRFTPLVVVAAGQAAGTIFVPLSALPCPILPSLLLPHQSELR